MYITSSGIYKNGKWNKIPPGCHALLEFNEKTGEHKVSFEKNSWDRKRMSDSESDSDHKAGPSAPPPPKAPVELTPAQKRRRKKTAAKARRIAREAEEAKAKKAGVVKDSEGATTSEDVNAKAT